MTPDEILGEVYRDVSDKLDQPLVEQPDILSNIKLVSRNISNRAGVRVILACSLAKLYDDSVDIKKTVY